MAQEEQEWLDKQATHYSRQHIVDIVGTSNFLLYQDWCKKNGFKGTIRQKSWREREKEKLFIARCAADAKLKKQRDFKSPRKALKLIFNNKIERPSQEPYAQIFDFYNSLSDSGQKKLFKKFIQHLEKYSNILDSELLVRGIVNILSFYDSSIRPYTSWKAKSHNPEKQFSELLRHLFTKYSVPSFMDQIWYRETISSISSDTQRQWFIFIGHGGNLRKAANLPFSLTKKMVHHFLEAPNSFTITQALLWGQIHSLGGDARVVYGIMGTRLQNCVTENAFWQSVFRFFINNPFLDTAQYGPIIDYIYYMKFEPQIVWVDRGRREQQPPPQPNFSMQRRDPNALLRHVEAWHYRLTKERKKKEFNWEHHPDINDYTYETKTREKLKIWTISELLSSRELQAEGKALNHCVGSYAGSCANGRCSIWSVKLETFAGIENKATVEINREGVLVQIRSKHNAKADSKTLNIIYKWARKEKIQISQYLTR